jgi:hypothetical protein
MLATNQNAVRVPGMNSTKNSLMNIKSAKVLPCMTQVPVNVVTAILHFPWIKVKKNKDGTFLVIAEKESYVVA